MCDSAGARAAAAGGERSARAAMRRSDETACAGTPRGAPARACAGVSCELSPRGVRSAQTPLGGPRTTGGRSESRQRAVWSDFRRWRGERGAETRITVEITELSKISFLNTPGRLSSPGPGTHALVDGVRSQSSDSWNLEPTCTSALGCGLSASRDASHCCAHEPSLGLTTMSSVMVSRSTKCFGPARVITEYVPPRSS